MNLNGIKRRPSYTNVLNVNKNGSVFSLKLQCYSFYPKPDKNRPPGTFAHCFHSRYVYKQYRQIKLSLPSFSCEKAPVLFFLLQQMQSSNWIQVHMSESEPFLYHPKVAHCFLVLKMISRYFTRGFDLTLFHCNSGRVAFNRSFLSTYLRH